MIIGPHPTRTLVTFSIKAIVKMIASLYMGLVTLLLFGASEQTEEKKAKVICHFKRLANTDILKMPEALKLKWLEGRIEAVNCVCGRQLFGRFQIRSEFFVF